MEYKMYITIEFPEYSDHNENLEVLEVIKENIEDDLTMYNAKITDMEIK